ncbi:MAG TPA: enolase C-terminal domain-like protein [Mycobacterium sp.]|nr:enolase C-terminal domain-like protein [Mycobacterium sp.]
MRTLIEVDGAPVFAIAVHDGTGRAAVHEGVLIEGAQGWGEFSPPASADVAEVANWFTAATEAGTIGWPDAVRGRVPVAVTVGAVDPQEAYDIVAASGCRTAEVSVGEGPQAADIERLAAVRSALGPSGALRCDAGQRWDPDTAIAAIPALATAAGGLQYVAAPSRTLDETVMVRAAVDVPVAVEAALLADRSRAEPAAIATAADVVVLRCAPLGGVRRALRFAERTGLPCVVSSAGETSIGLSAGIALAGALPELPFACALGTATQLVDDVVSEARSLIPVDGYLPVAPMPPRPDPARLQRCRITDSAREAWWRDRLHAAVAG